MARINYDAQTARAYKAVREVPRDGLSEWREAIRRHLRPAPGMTVVDIGAGTGQFATAFSDWFDVKVVAVEPSAAMREQIPRTPAIEAVDGDALALPMADESANAAWLSLVIHHIPDLEGAAHEIRRVLRPEAPVLIRQGFPGRLNKVELVRWFPETARAVDAYPSVTETCNAFAAAGFDQEALEPVRETYSTSLAGFLGQLHGFRAADTTMRTLTEDEFLRGKERLRRAVRNAADQTRSNWLDLLVLRRRRAPSDTPGMEWPAPLTIREVAAELGCSEEDVRALIRDDELRTVACGIRPGLVPRHQLDAYLLRLKHRLRSSATP